MEYQIPLNVSAKKSMVVESVHTAKYIGSGRVEVLATPMMIALIEAAAQEAVQLYLPKGWITVGKKVDVEHMRPSPLGEVVTAEAILVKVDGRALDFSVQAKDRFGLIGQGHHQRFIVNVERFLEKVRERK